MQWSFYDFNNWFHAGLGFVAVAGALVALATIKGSMPHRRGGWVFVLFMAPVVITTGVMMVHEFLPLAVVLTLAEVYLIPAALLSVNRGGRGFVAGSVALIVLVGLLFAFASVQFVRLNLISDQVFIGPLVLATMFGFLLFQDLHMLASHPTAPNYWIRRHLTRMILAFTIAIMALVRIGLDFGLSLEASVVLPVVVAALGILWIYRRYPLTPRPSGT